MDDAKIKQLMTEVMEEQRDTFWVAPKQHFLDHEQMKHCRENQEEWMENHEFVSEVRVKKKIVESTGLKVFVVAACSSVLAFLGWLFDLFTFKVGG